MVDSVMLLPMHIAGTVGEQLKCAVLFMIVTREGVLHSTDECIPLYLYVVVKRTVETAVV